MPRIRTIKPDFWTDELIGSLSREARLLFIATWNLADDKGRLRWSARYLWGAVFPFDDDISADDVQRIMDELTDAGVVVSYEAGGKKQRLAYVKNFGKHQYINRPRPSQLAAPGSEQPIENTEEEPDDELDGDAHGADHGIAHGADHGIDPCTCTEPISGGMEGKGREGKGSTFSDSHSEVPCRVPLHSNPQRRRQSPPRRGEVGVRPNGHDPPDEPKLQASPSSDEPPCGSDPADNEETALFHRGKAVLGAKAAGLIRKLLDAKGKNVALARAAIEQASTKQDPREFISAMIRGPPPDGRNMSGMI